MTNVAKGLEFEGSFRFGVLGLRGGATYTDAKIDKDYLDPRLNGHVPRAQPKLLFQASPEIDLSRVTFGATFIGGTKSFAQEENRLVIPAFVTTNAFLEVRPADRRRLIVNASNLFDTVALTGLEFLVAFLQAYVFAVLTCMYLNDAVHPGGH